MSQGKYSPKSVHGKVYKYNCFGKLPESWTNELAEQGVKYNEQTMFVDYDDEGFDRYGYSAFDKVGDYVGMGNGVDRAGYTEQEYLCMDEDEFQDIF